ncbi:MAG TPA: CPBP family intramembrane glutamic endopeptidase [Aeromicrobium sp.]|nr:CPBP family intramembrane glutamic endopeptidase [Aeromicrobium sp.]
MKRDATVPNRRRLGAEVWLVLGLSLGASAIYSVLSLADKLSRGPLRDATATLNRSASDRPWFDLTYQLVGIGLALVPVLLALYFMVVDGDERSVRDRLGLDREAWWGSLLWGAGLAALIGLPGLVVYAVGREIGITAEIVTSGLDQYWWTVPVLILQAAKNAIVEEVVVVGFLMTRLRRIGWGLPATLVTSALLRGSYHLYQGFGQAFGNVVMGLIFGWWFHRTRRVVPLVVAHTILDIVSFVGYHLFADQLGLS